MLENGDKGESDVLPILRTEKTEVEKSPRQGVSETVKEYVSEKTPKVDLQEEMKNRAVEVARRGAKVVHKDIVKIFPESELENHDSEQLKQEQLEILAGQEEKIERMNQFVDNMTAWSDQLITEFSEGIEAENYTNKDFLIEDYTKKIKNLVVEVTRTITYQDIKANAVALGDHGWMHLTQNLRDSQIIVAGKKERVLSAKEKFILGLASALHDIGYAVPEVSDLQRESGGKYGSYDKGHPVNSYVYLVAQKNKLRSVLGEEAAESLFQIVVNHENPERAARAGKYEYLSEAFAQSDASAAFGKDKLPPVVVQIPEILSYLNALNIKENFSIIFEQLKKSDEYLVAIKKVKELEDELVNIKTADGSIVTQDYFQQEISHQLSLARENLDQIKVESLENQRSEFQKQVIDSLRERVLKKIDVKILYSAPDSVEDKKEKLLYQADALKNSLDHFSPISLKFLLGRMSAESLPIIVGEDKKIELVINSGFSRQLEEQGIIENSVKSSAKLTVKLFLELSAIKVESSQLEDKLIQVVIDNENPSEVTQKELSKLGINIEVISDESDRSVRLISETLNIVSKTDMEISADNKDFYDGIYEQLNHANQVTGQFIISQRNK